MLRIRPFRSGPRLSRGPQRTVVMRRILVAAVVVEEEVEKSVKFEFAVEAIWWWTSLSPENWIKKDKTQTYEMTKASSCFNEFTPLPS